MKLSNLDACDQNGLNLFSNLAPCFLLLIMIKCNKSKIMKINVLLDFGASTCFIDNELMQQCELPFMKIVWC